MIGNNISLILLPTNKCNVDCEYCFEDKTDDFMSLGQLSIITDKILDHMETNNVHRLIIYWQGGEVMMIPTVWFDEAQELIGNAFAKRNKVVSHSLQSNMIGYHKRWNRLIREMFGNSVGTSMDFPNLYRKAKGRPAAEYTDIWARNVREARDAGIQIGVIAIPNKETLRLGAERFYSYFVDEMQVTDFQVNTSFSGGKSNEAKLESILDVNGLGRFFVDLAGIWFERGYDRGVKIGPLDELMNHFSGRVSSLPCIWQQNCADEFVSIDARGFVAQCDCWVTSYSDYQFGNIFEPGSFTDLMKNSPARKKFAARPLALVSDGTCLDCDYLSICHGGCPVRAYSITGYFTSKDPYCKVYKDLFSCIEKLSIRNRPAVHKYALPIFAPIPQSI